MPPRPPPKPSCRGVALTSESAVNSTAAAAAAGGLVPSSGPWAGHWAALAHSRVASKGVALSARAALGPAAKSAMRSTASGAHPLAHDAYKGCPPLRAM